MHTLSFLRETTIEHTHSVGCSTFKMWPSLSISLSFFITLSRKAAGCLLTGRMVSLAPGLILIEKVPGRVPVTLARSGTPLLFREALLFTGLVHESI